MSGAKNPRIVVGVDGSEPSKEALRWAARQAALVGTDLDAVVAWAYPEMYWGWAPGEGVAPLREQAATTLAKRVEEVLGSASAVEARQRVLRAEPATALLESSAGADLLVVGNRGHGAFFGALLGSVSYRCVHHATCPVVVVHGHRE
ncbi:MAG: universal stress protein [Streptosporangiales bacterium]|nr:universal stress protein [Streptosporangiales bacterium]